MSKAEPVIIANGLSCSFGDLIAVDDLSLEIQAGEVFGFLGHNGAGKTTTVRLLNGILAPTGGAVRVLGLEPLSDGPSLRRRTGVLTETPSLDERLTGRENLEIYAQIYGVPRITIAARAGELLERAELGDRADERVGDYSRGMKQRLALSRALLHEPELLFLDEPTSGLDPVATRRVHELIVRLSRKEGRTVFLCTHNLVEAQNLCNRVAVLEHGRLVALGTPSDLAQQLGRSLRLEIEIEPDNLETARRTLSSLVAGPELESEGGTLTVVGAQRDQIPDLVAALVAQGVRIYRVAQQTPSLEDVYFALHGEGGGSP
jgi:ABC-2 type transport system ATP-binding protein